MNDRPPSGVSTPIDTAPDASYAAYDASYEQSCGQGVQYGYATGVGYPSDDPLFGALPGYEQGQSTAPATAAPYGGYDTCAPYDSGGYGVSPLWSASGTYGTYGTEGHGLYTGCEEYGAQALIPTQPDYGWAPAAETADASGQWDATSYGTGTGTVPYPASDFDTGGYDTTNWDWDSGSYPHVPEQQHPDQDQPDTGFDPGQASEPAGEEEAASGLDTTPDADPDQSSWSSDAPADPDSEAEAEASPEASPLAAAPRGRRRAPKPKRSALLTVAVPSVAVMGVAGIAAASVNGTGADGDDKPAQAADDPTQVKASAANSKLDTQLAGVSADAGDFADRASRTQERIDLKERQEAERKRKEAEAARKEALRPKFALPVAQRGLSAYYGQAGVNWLSVHTGIDFPVSYGSPVRAATDGTVTTKWDLSYGNMAIVTAADGTETWYCHLSSTKIRSGQVKAGDTIAYSGNSGKSTGPHLHFEVRPGGGSAIDPLAWFRAKGLDPT